MAVVIGVVAVVLEGIQGPIYTVYVFNGLQVSKFLEGSYYIFLAQGAQVVRDFFDTVMILYYCNDQLGER